MSSDLENQQNQMLNKVRKERRRVSVFLVNGIKLVGHIESFDQYLVMLSSASGIQAVYKHAISTIQEDTNTPVRRPTTTETQTSSGTPRDAAGEQTVAISYKRRPAIGSRE